MTEKTVTELCTMLKSREISAQELAQRYLENIQRKDKDIGAYITVCGERALESAQRVDRMRESGEELCALAGIPFALKDNFCTEGIRTTCGSRMLESFVPSYSATAVTRLEERGAVMLGKTNMDEFGMGSTTDTSFFGATANPLDLSRTAGGSSGGSAAAVVGGMAAFALGSDTGGSVRLPAAFCGCVGLKPTRGAISRYGLVAFASSLDTVGVLARSVCDAQTVFGALAGKDALDATSRDILPPERADGALKIGICEQAMEWAQPNVRECVGRAALRLEGLGARIVSISLPPPDVCVAAYYVICTAEASSNLGRYDGIRYGYRAHDPQSIDDLFLRSRSESFGEEVKRRIALGTLCLHGEGREQYYASACAARRSIMEQVQAALSDCDALLLPVSPSVAYKTAQKPSSALDVWRGDALCVMANLCGLPSLCVPFGQSEDMPVGVQLMGKADSEELLFSVGKMLSEVQDA